MVRWIVGSAGVLLLACVTAVTIGTLRSARPRAMARDQRDQAMRAVWEARTAGAARWAPDTLARAEQSARDAWIIMQAQEGRLRFLANFAAAASAWSLVRGAAQDATEQSIVTKRDAQNRSQQAIVQAQSAVSGIVITSKFMHLGSNGQMLLSRAQLALIESRALHRQEEYSGAQERAEWSAGVAGRLNDEATSIANRYFQKGSIATWHRWKHQLVARSRSARQPAILVEKAEHRLTLYLSGEPVQFYDVELGSKWISAKTYSGDAATPEGQYRIVSKKDRGESAYHRALLLNYPNEQDRRAFAQARRDGLVPSGARVGGLIEIHGAGRRGEDWTRGCVALSDRDIDALFPWVHVGTPVTIIGGSGQKLYESLRH
jgi:lipoprotein-anchoring transpeptidase ErfK/SrfK